MTRGPKQSIFVGDEFNTNNSGKCRVLRYENAYKILVKFIETGYEDWAVGSALRGGRVKDPLVRNYYGEGCIGTGPYTVTNRAGQIWSQMLSRCYNPSATRFYRYGGRGVTVSDEWKNLQNFCQWYCGHYINGYHLDKDLKIPHSTMYSKDTCVFVPQEVNTLLTASNAKRGDYPVGVSFYKISGKYKAKLNIRNKQQHLGYYQTPEEAFQVYKAAKEKHVKEVAQEYYTAGKIPIEVYQTLMTWEAIPYPD